MFLRNKQRTKTNRPPSPQGILAILTAFCFLVLTGIAYSLSFEGTFVFDGRILSSIIQLLRVSFIY